MINRIFVFAHAEPAESRAVAWGSGGFGGGAPGRVTAVYKTARIIIIWYRYIIITR